MLPRGMDWTLANYTRTNKMLRLAKLEVFDFASTTRILGSFMSGSYAMTLGDINLILTYIHVS